MKPKVSSAPDILMMSYSHSALKTLNLYPSYNLIITVLLLLFIYYQLSGR